VPDAPTVAALKACGSRDREGAVLAWWYGYFLTVPKEEE